MNDIIFRSLSSAGIPAAKETTGLTRLDDKRPDGLTLVPWQGGKPVTWDITVVSTLAQYYLHASGHYAAGAQNLLSLGRKPIILSPELSYCPNRARNSRTIAPCSLDFLTRMGWRLSATKGDARETVFLFQCISVALQRFNAVLIHESFVAPDVEPDV